MGLWNGSTLNTNRAASVVNQLWSKTFIDAVRQQTALLYLILGKNWNDRLPPGLKTGFQVKKDVTGDQIEVRMLGQLDSISTVANGAAGVATATPNYNAARFGGMKFKWAHYFDNYAISSDEYNQITGSDAKTYSFIDDNVSQIQLSFEKTLNTDINAAVGTGPSDTVMGNWVQASSDGVTGADTAFATYGVDRSDAANALLRGTVTPNTGNITMKKIRLLKNQISAKGGQNQLALAETSLFTAIQGLTDPFTVINSNEDWMQFGGEWVQHGKTKYCMEPMAPADRVGFLDPMTWGFWMKDINLANGFFEKAGWLKAAYVLPWEVFTQLICVRPASNGALLNCLP